MRGPDNRRKSKLRIEPSPSSALLIGAGCSTEVEGFPQTRPGNPLSQSDAASEALIAICFSHRDDEQPVECGRREPLQLLANPEKGCCDGSSNRVHSSLPTLRSTTPRPASAAKVGQHPVEKSNSAVQGIHKNRKTARLVISHMPHRHQRSRRGRSTGLGARRATVAVASLNRWRGTLTRAKRRRSSGERLKIRLDENLDGLFAGMNLDMNRRSPKSTSCRRPFAPRIMAWGIIVSL